VRGEILINERNFYRSILIVKIAGILKDISEILKPTLQTVLSYPIYKTAWRAAPSPNLGIIKDW